MQVGDRVRAKWRNGFVYFPGVIGAVNGNGTFDIVYDNGVRGRSVPPDRIRLTAGGGAGEQRPSL